MLASEPAGCNLLALGYVVISGGAIDDWARFGEDMLGLQIADRSSRRLAFRMDDRAHRLIISAEASAPIFGWEVHDADALARMGARLDAAGVRASLGSRSLASERQVAELVRFCDPVGNVIELFHGAANADDAFTAGRRMTGFRTGRLGMGHVVLTVETIDAVMPFYRDVLGFRLSDYALRPFRAFFFHLNSRHHSLAFVETGRTGIHHLMMETNMLDDVGQGYDLAMKDMSQIGATLGRHTNDYMTSFYVWSPADLMIEYGWGGRDIEVATWQPHELEFGPSLWGHDRTWLSADGRAEARAMRLEAAAAGEQRRVQVLPDRYDILKP